MADQESDQCPFCKRDLQNCNSINRARHLESCERKKRKQRRPPTPPCQDIKKFFSIKNADPVNTDNTKENTAINPGHGSTDQDVVVVDPDLSIENLSVSPNHGFTDQDSENAEEYSAVNVDLGSTDQVICKTSSAETQANAQFCQGFSFWQEKGIMKNFPFQLLFEPNHEQFVINGYKLHHIDCHKQNYFIFMSSDSNFSNKCCMDLQFNTRMKNIHERSLMSYEDNTYLNHMYMNYNQLESKLKIMEQSINANKLNILNKNRRIDSINTTLSFHQRLLALISNNDVPRLQQLLKVALNNNKSLHHIIGKVVDAIEGIYKAQSTGKEKDLAFLILKIGGPSLLDICYKANILPSSATAYKIASNFIPIQSSINLSAEQCFKLNIPLTIIENSHAISFKVDETFCTSRLRINEKTGEVQGICYQHGKENLQYLKFKSFEEAEALHHQIHAEKLHVPKECLVTAVNCMDKTETVQIGLVWPTCSKKDAIGIVEIFKAAAADIHERTGNSLMNFNTDGDSTRRLVLHNYIMINKADDTTQVGKIIIGIPLVDRNCGVNLETVSYDPKHLIKRLWNTIINQSTVIANITLLKDDLKILLLLANDVQPLQVDALVHPKDKQNVPAATKFMLLLIEVLGNDDSIKRLSFRLQGIIPELKLLANIIDGLLHFYVYSDSTIEQQLQAISFAANCLLILFRHSKGIMPNQLYHDIQSTFIDALFCCAKASVHFPDKPLYLVQNGTDPLERFFGNARMVLSNRSDDSLSLIQTMSAIKHVDHILTTKHPEWTRKSKVSRRLCLDYSSPSSWNADGLKMSASGKSVEAIWKEGMYRASLLLLQLLGQEYRPFLLEAEGITLKKPHGKIIGVDDKVSELEDIAAAEIDTDNGSFDNENDRDEQTNIAEETPTDDLDDIELSDIISPKTITIDNKEVYKSTVLKQIYSSEPLSKDRLKRVRGLSKTPGNADSVEGLEHLDSFIYCGDPVVAKIQNRCVISNIVKIKLANKIEKKYHIEEQNCPNLILDIHELNLRDHENKLLWGGKYSGSIITIKGEFCVPLKPNINLNPLEGMSVFEFNKNDLMSIGAALPETPDDSDSHQYSKCKLCNKSIKTREMRSHVGAHILSDNLQYRCGFCGGPNGNCENKLIISSKKKGKSFYKVSSICHNKILNLKKPDALSRRNKCTNHVLMCPRCSSTQWKYNLPEHFADSHKEFDIPIDLIISDKERSNLKL